VDKDRIRPDHWLRSVLCFLLYFEFDPVDWVTGRKSVPLITKVFFGNIWRKTSKNQGHRKWAIKMAVVSFFLSFVTADEPDLSTSS